MNITVNSTIELSSIITSSIAFISTSILIYVTRSNINKNANINNRVEWARELRKEVSNYMSLVFIINQEKEKVIDKITESACKIILLLNSSDVNQSELTTIISNINEKVITELTTNNVTNIEINNLRDYTHLIIEDVLKELKLRNI